MLEPLVIVGAFVILVIVASTLFDRHYKWKDEKRWREYARKKFGE